MGRIFFFFLWFFLLINKRKHGRGKMSNCLVRFVESYNCCVCHSGPPVVIVIWRKLRKNLWNFVNQFYLLIFVGALFGGVAYLILCYDNLQKKLSVKRNPPIEKVRMLDCIFLVHIHDLVL